jgi:hypothetical protein
VAGPTGKGGGNWLFVAPTSDPRIAGSVWTLGTGTGKLVISNG